MAMLWAYAHFPRCLSEPWPESELPLVRPGRPSLRVSFLAAFEAAHFWQTGAVDDGRALSPDPHTHPAAAPIPAGFFSCKSGERSQMADHPLADRLDTYRKMAAQAHQDAASASSPQWRIGYERIADTWEELVREIVAAIESDKRA
jgi:hypothetical protein